MLIFLESLAGPQLSQSDQSATSALSAAVEVVRSVAGGHQLLSEPTAGATGNPSHGAMAWWAFLSSWPLLAAQPCQVVP